MVHIHAFVLIVVTNYTLHLLIIKEKFSTMSGTKKPSNTLSPQAKHLKKKKEVEIPLDDEPSDIVIQTPNPEVVDPEYFECTEEYTIFDSIGGDYS
jgi:hypothetical protein